MCTCAWRAQWLARPGGLPSICQLPWRSQDTRDVNRPEHLEEISPCINRGLVCTLQCTLVAKVLSTVTLTDPRGEPTEAALQHTAINRLKVEALRLSQFWFLGLLASLTLSSVSGQPRHLFGGLVGVCSVPCWLCWRIGVLRSTSCRTPRPPPSAGPPRGLQRRDSQST